MFSASSRRATRLAWRWSMRADRDDTPALLAHALHTQIDMHQAYGGVVPELASRDHIRRVCRWCAR